jgi:hypothetical protein
MQGMANIPLGTEDAAGNPEYLTQFGLPFESLSQVPNISDDFLAFARQTGKNVIGSAQPLLKQAGSAFYGTDPYFGSAFASYDKPQPLFEAMGMEPGGLSRAYNALAGSGVIQPLHSLVSSIGIPLGDEPAWQSALTGLTGARIRAVDPDRAEAQQIEAYLRENPAVRQRVSYYQTGEEDPEFAALLDAMREAKQRAKERREQLELAGVTL